MNRIYDSIREESRTVREKTTGMTEMVEQFENLRDAAQDPTPGKLTLIYEQENESFVE